MSTKTTGKLYDNFKVMPGRRECPDPFVLRFDSKYYLYFTCGGRKMYAYESEDLIDFKLVKNGILEEGVIYDYDQDENHPESETPFAPEVCYYDGFFYMIASPSGNGHYIFKSESPCGPFKCISKNLGRKIDGSFFLDSDQKIYIYGAFDDGIKIYSVSDDFMEIGKDETFIPNAKLGHWTEGPYMLKREGKYYLTYCGAHFLSKDYRVDYCMANDGSDLMDASSYKRKETVLISTEGDFYGLGHSCTVLGPDLDSYFMVYHNLTDNGRYYNMSRLSFGPDGFILNGVRKNDIPYVESAYTIKNGDNLIDMNGAYLVDKSTEETYSVEFNNVGTGRMLFAYFDDEHYSYIEFAGKTIRVGNHIYEDKVLREVVLRHPFRTDVLHSFFIQYKNRRLLLSFDHMELFHDLNFAFGSGFVGYQYKNGFSKISSTSISGYAFGSSEETYSKGNIILGTSFDRSMSVSRLDRNQSAHLPKSRLLYHFYVAESGDYSFYFTHLSDFRIIYDLIFDHDTFFDLDTLDDPEAIMDSEYLRTKMLNIWLEKGEHVLEIQSDDMLCFKSIDYEKKTEPKTFDLLALNKDELIFRNLGESEDYANIDTTDKKSFAILTKESFSDCLVTASLEIKNIKDGGSINLFLNEKYYCENFIEDGDTKDNPNSYTGITFSLENGSLKLKKTDFNYTEVLETLDVFTLNGNVEMSISIRGNIVECFLNGEKRLSHSLRIGNLNGGIGLLTYEADVIVKSLKTRNNRTKL